jgi:hypothetical protein
VALPADGRWPHRFDIAREALYRELRTEPRFQAVLRRMNLPPTPRENEPGGKRLVD